MYFSLFSQNSVVVAFLYTIITIQYFDTVKIFLSNLKHQIRNDDPWNHNVCHIISSDHSLLYPLYESMRDSVFPMFG